MSRITITGGGVFSSTNISNLNSNFTELYAGGSGQTFASPVITGTVTGGASYTAPTLTSPVLTGIAANTNTVTAASQATTRYIQSSLTLTPATTFSVSAGGSIAAVRGDITVSTGKTFVDGFLYGAQGKFTLAGTMAQTSAGRAVGLLGQVDYTGGTVTAGQVSAVWADLQGTGATLTSDEVNVLRVTNSSASTVNAMTFFYGQSTYFFTAGRDGGTPTYFGAAAPTSLEKSLKIDVSGTTYYIGLYTAAS